MFFVDVIFIVDVVTPGKVYAIDGMVLLHNNVADGTVGKCLSYVKLLLYSYITTYYTLRTCRVGGNCCGYYSR